MLVEGSAGSLRSMNQLKGLNTIHRLLGTIFFHLQLVEVPVVVDGDCLSPPSDLHAPSGSASLNLNN